MKVVEEERDDAQLVRRERLEDLIDGDRREGTLDAGVLAAHDEVGAAVVLSNRAWKTVSRGPA